MNYGPLEFATYLERRVDRRDSATVSAARAAAPVERAQMNRLSVVSGNTSLARIARAARIDAISVYEAVAMFPPLATRFDGPVTVAVKNSHRPVVLVLSAHQTIQWEITVAKGAELHAVLLSGYGESTVGGAGDTLVTSIGGFYAFKRGSAEFKHLESEVMRCTGRRINTFHSIRAGNSFEI